MTRKRLLASEVFSSFRDEVRSGSICRICLNLGNEVWDLGYRERHNLGMAYGAHRKPVEDVAIAAQQGCPGCEIIAWALEPYMKQLQGSGQVVVSFDHIGEATSNILIYRNRLPSPATSNTVVTIKESPPKPGRNNHLWTNSLTSPWRLIPAASMVTHNTGSSAASAKVQEWYSECLLSHIPCHSDARTPLPTRVIHIQGPKKVRLYSTDAEYADYACLSYCWGQQSFIRTTKTTLEQYTVDIPWKELPLAFQDAIRVANKIGFKYLWIDSLCIIQDSVEDWRHEGSLMSRIYANASITLSATRAASPHQGCFARLDERYISRTKAFTNRDDNTYELHCHEQLPNLKTPLFERGWAFQERMLSKRIVHFMDQELWWECRKCFRCECGLPTHSSNRRQHDNAFVINELSSLKDIEDIWGNLAETYSAKSLTYPSDIFPAIQALAKLIPSKMGRYLAGHWESTLLQSLCWRSDETNESKLGEWRAPSWSWAAAPGRVTWYHSGHDSKTTTYATVVSAMTKPKGDDPMGQISYGAIVLRGRYLVGRVLSSFPYSFIELRSPLQMSTKSFECLPYWDQTGYKTGTEIIALRILEIDTLDAYGMSVGCDGQWLLLRGVWGVAGEYTRIGIVLDLHYAEGTRMRIRRQIEGVMEEESAEENLEDVMEEEAVEGEFKII